MEPNEGIVIKKQYASFFIALILFVPLSFLSVAIFHSMKYGVVITLAIMLYIGISSIKNRISIIRPKGQMKYSKGKRAVVYGVITLVGITIQIVFFLTPLSDRLFVLP